MQGFALGEVHRHRVRLFTVLDVHTKHVRVALIPIGAVACRHNIAPPFMELQREARANIMYKSGVIHNVG